MQGFRDTLNTPTASAMAAGLMDYIGGKPGIQAEQSLVADAVMGGHEYKKVFSLKCLDTANDPNE